MLPAQLRGLLGVRQFLLRQPVSLLAATNAVSGELPASFPNVKVDRLDAEDVRRVSAAAAAAKVSVNDWLLRDFFGAVDEFRPGIGHRGPRLDPFFGAHESASSGRRSHAGGQRGEHDFSGPHSATNRQPRGTAAGVHAEMDLIRRHQLGLIFVLSLSVLRLLPGGLAKRVNKGRCEATCVFSNLGRIMADSPLPRCNEKIVAGNVLLDGADVFAPVRDGTAVSVALAYYAGGLQLCMQYDSRRITEAHADELLASYVRRIRTSLDTAGRALQAKAA